MINSLPITLPLLPPTSADGAGSVRMLCLRCSSYFFVLQLAAELAVRHRVRAAGAFPHMPWLLQLKQRALAVLLAVPCSVAFPLPRLGPSLVVLLVSRPLNRLFSHLVVCKLSLSRRVYFRQSGVFLVTVVTCNLTCVTSLPMSLYYKIWSQLRITF